LITAHSVTANEEKSSKPDYSKRSFAAPRKIFFYFAFTCGSGALTAMRDGPYHGVFVKCGVSAAGETKK